ncbi:MAG: polysaccharide deacetylase family protein [Elusimicrobia bacterium]|nr:polysaccharide deacetylase family protein [Elusimicrobiota bacterium]
MKKAGIALAALLLAGYGAYRLSKSRTFQLFGGLTSRVETDRRVVALTFDDAPTPATPSVLELLAAEGVKATFYCIGSNIEKDPAGAARIAAAGHELGNHTYSHLRMVFKAPYTVASEVERTTALIRGAGYKGPVTFRPPYGKKLVGLPYYLRSRGIPTVTWDLEPDTCFPGDAARIEEYTVSGARPGSIILLHALCGEACAADRAALPGIIRGLKAAGFTFVRVSDLLAEEK